MLLKFIRSNRLGVLIIISLLPVAIWVPSLFRIASLQAPEANGFILSRVILSFNRDHRIVASLIALVLLCANGYMLIQLNTIHVIIPVRTQLPLLFYTILIIGVNELHQLTPALISASFLILVFYRIFHAYKADGISKNFLDAGILIALASLFYLPAIGFFFFLITAIFILRPVNWRELVFAFIGILIPYIFVFSIYYLIGKPLSDYINDISGSINRHIFSKTLPNIIGLVYVGFLVLTGSYFMIFSIGTMKIHARKFFLVLLGYFLFCVLLYLIVPYDVTGIAYFIAVPLAYLFTHYFIKCRRNWGNELFFIIFLLLLFWQTIN
jgi:hypothetical protein